MINKLSTVVFAVILALSSAACAEEKQGGFVVRGMGAVNCKQLIEALKGNNRAVVSGRLVAWLSGYLSYASRTHPAANDVLPLDNLDGFATIVARVCANNPEARVESVSYSVLTTLEPLAGKKPETAAELKQNNVTVSIRPSLLLIVQQRLEARGHLPLGSADGAFGDQTMKALQQFQNSVGLKQTGLPDLLTVYLLQTAN